MRSGYKTSKDLTGFSTVHLIGASNAVLNTITHKRFWDATCCRIYSPTWAGTLAIFTACEQNKKFKHLLVARRELCDTSFLHKEPSLPVHHTQ